MATLYARAVEYRNPFRIERLPLLAHLFRMVFHRYRKRWAKRLFKRPARMTFDLFYHSLRLKGTGRMLIAFPSGECSVSFDARNAQFGAVYALPDGVVYECDVLALLDAFLGPDSIFFDVGANWGYFPLYVAGSPGFRGVVHAFEPLPDSFRDLSDLTRQAGLEGSIRCHPLALSDRAGSARMAVPDRVSSGLAKLIGGTEGVEVTLARLDDLDLPDPDFIKLDVEDHEYQVLRGGADLIGRAKPHIVFENWLRLDDPAVTAAPLAFIQRLGYLMFHTCWRYCKDGAWFVWPSDVPPADTPDRVLALVPMSTEQRFLMGDRVHVFACHRDRLGELETRFSRDGFGPGRPPAAARPR